MAFDARISCESCAFRYDAVVDTLRVTPIAESFARGDFHAGFTRCTSPDAR